MIDSSPEPLSPEGLPSPNAPPESDTIRWSIVDIIVFGIFFGLTIIVLPEVLLRIVHIFDPEVQRTDIPAVLQVLFQVVMDLVLVGFIVFLVGCTPRVLPFSYSLVSQSRVRNGFSDRAGRDARGFRADRIKYVSAKSASTD
jgi:hypothetical protein